MRFRIPTSGLDRLAGWCSPPPPPPVAPTPPAPQVEPTWDAQRWLDYAATNIWWDQQEANPRASNKANLRTYKGRPKKGPPFWTPILMWNPHGQGRWTAYIEDRASMVRWDDNPAEALRLLAYHVQEVIYTGAWGFCIPEDIHIVQPKLMDLNWDLPVGLSDFGKPIQFGHVPTVLEPAWPSVEFHLFNGGIVLASPNWDGSPANVPKIVFCPKVNHYIGFLHNTWVVGTTLRRTAVDLHRALITRGGYPATPGAPRHAYYSAVNVNNPTLIDLVGR